MGVYCTPNQTMRHLRKMIAKVRIQDSTYDKDGVKVDRIRFTADEVELIPTKDSSSRITTEEIPF